MVETLDLVVYNPNDSIGIPKSITEFAPLSVKSEGDFDDNQEVDFDIKAPLKGGYLANLSIPLTKKFVSYSFMMDDTTTIVSILY